MTQWFRKLLRFHWPLFFAMAGLAVFGIVAIYSCTHLRENPAYALMWRKQALWVAGSAAAFFAVSFVPYRWVRWGALPLYGLSVAFLALTLRFGVSKDGARCWLRAGPVLFQPAQMAVLSGILIMALFLALYPRLHPVWKIAACGILAGAPALLILIQPDLGECLMWVPVVAALLFIARIPLRYLTVLALLAAMAVPLAYCFKLKPYQQQRIVSFLDPEVDAQGSSWAVNQCLLAIGSGGWNGKGFLAKETLVELGYIPATTLPNDYIFSAIGEEWGFVGSAGLVAGFAALLGSCLWIGARARDRLGRYLSCGVLALLFAHIFQNIGMNMGLLPVTGVPLPLISYSGSFVSMVIVALGLLNSVWIHRKA